MFRVERHKKIGGTEIDIFIPRSDNPDKEEKFISRFIPALAPAVAVKPTDNIKAMCESGKLTPEQKTQLCQPAPATEQEQTAPVAEQAQAAPGVSYPPTNYADAMADARKKG
jgi:deoxyribose-phosphate aldolase